MGQSCSSSAPAAPSNEHADAKTWRTAVLDAYQELKTTSGAGKFPAASCAIIKQEEADEPLEELPGVRKRAFPRQQPLSFNANPRAEASHDTSAEDSDILPTRRQRLAAFSDMDEDVASQTPFSVLPVRPPTRCAQPPALLPASSKKVVVMLPAAQLMPLPMSATRQATGSSEEPSPAGDMGRLEAALSDLYDSHDKSSLQLQAALMGTTTDAASGLDSAAPSAGAGAGPSKPGHHQDGGRRGCRPPSSLAYSADTVDSHGRPSLLRSISRETDGALASASAEGDSAVDTPPGSASAHAESLAVNGCRQDQRGDTHERRFDAAAASPAPCAASPSYSHGMVHQIPYPHPHAGHHHAGPSSLSAQLHARAHAAPMQTSEAYHEPLDDEDAHADAMYWSPSSENAAPAPPAHLMHALAVHAPDQQPGPRQPWLALPPRASAMEDEQRHSTAVSSDDRASTTDDSSSKEQTRKPWLAAEDQTIVDSVRDMGFKWRLIAGMLPGRSDDAVRNRWNRLQEAIRDGQRVGENTVKEKAGYKCSKCGQPKRNHVCTYQPGASLTSQAAPHVPQRQNRQIAVENGEKLRVSWTKHEDDTIRNCYGAMGPRWSLIAAQLPGRTEHAVRNRWHRLLNLDAQAVGADENGGDDGVGLPPTPRGDSAAPTTTTYVEHRQGDESGGYSQQYAEYYPVQYAAPGYMDMDMDMDHVPPVISDYGHPRASSNEM